MPPEYEVKPFSLDCFSLIKELYLSAYGTILHYEEFKRKYETSTLGAGVIGFLAIHKPTKSPAAYYGVFPLQLMVKGKRILAAQSGDTMTHQDHRNKGLFTALARICFDQCQKEGIELVFGLPNQYSYPGFIQKLNWQHVDDIERFDLKQFVKTLPIPKLCMRLRLFNLYLVYARVVLKKKIRSHVDDSPNPLTNSFDTVFRNKDFLNYKKSSDKFFIKIDNVVLWIKLTDILMIGDASDYSKIDSVLLRKLKWIAFFLGYNTINFHINRSIEKPLFLNQFKKYNSWPLCIYVFNKEYSNINLIMTGCDFDTW